MERTVSQYMSKNPVCFKETDKVGTIIKFMDQKRLTHVLVNNLNSKIVGIISRKDILDYLMYLLRESTSSNNAEMELENTEIKEIMTLTPIVVRGGDDMEDAIRLLNNHQIHCLPVVDEETKPIGVISFFDLLLGLMDQMHPPVCGFDPRNHFGNVSSWLTVSSWTK